MSEAPMRVTINAPTRKRNIIVIVQTRDLDHIRARLTKRLKKFDTTVFEIMPGVWHLRLGGGTGDLYLSMIGGVTDYEDDRVLILDDPRDSVAWDGHRGQYVRREDLNNRWIHSYPDANTNKNKRVCAEHVPEPAEPGWINGWVPHHSAKVAYPIEWNE